MPNIVEIEVRGSDKTKPTFAAVQRSVDNLGNSASRSLIPVAELGEVAAAAGARIAALGDSARAAARAVTSLGNAAAKAVKKMDGLEATSARLVTHINEIGYAASRAANNVDDLDDELDSLNHSTINVGRSVRGMGDNSDRTSGSVSGLTGRLVGMARVLSAVKVLATPALVASAIPSVVGLGAALAQAAGAGALLPAVLSAGAIAVAALKIGMSGFGEALKNVGDPAKFAEAIKGLAPSAQEAAKAIAGLKPRFDELKLSVQERLFAGLGEQISKVGSTYLPILDERFGRVADAANLAGLGIAGMLMESRRIADIKEIGNAAATSFEDMSAAAAPLAGVFLDVAKVGAEFLPRLTAGAEQAAQSFSDMVARMRESGQLHDIISGGLSALGDLAQIAGDVGSTLGGIFRAASVSGTGFLNTAKEITGALSEVVNSVAGQEALSAFFSTISVVARTVGQVLRDIAPSISAVIQSIQGLVAGSLPGLGSAFASAITSITPFVTMLLDLASFVLPPLVSALGFLAPALGPLAAYIGAIVVAVKAWSIAQAILNIALTANPIGIVVVAIGALIAALVLAWQHSETFRNIVMSVWEVIKTVVSTAIEVITALIGGQLNAVMELAGIAVNALKVAFETAFKIISLAIQTAIGIASEIIGGFVDYFQSIFNGLFGFISSITKAIVALFRGDFGAARDFAIAAFRSLLDGATGAVNALMGMVAGIGGRILGALGDLGGLLWSAGQRVIQGLIDGILSMLNAVRNAASRVASAVAGALPFSPAKFGPLKTHPPEIAGRRIVELLGEGLVGQLAQLRPIVERLAGTIQESLAGDLDNIMPSASSTAGRRSWGPRAGSAPGAVVIRLDSGGTQLDKLLLEVLSKSIRVQGGNVQLVLGGR